MSSRSATFRASSASATLQQVLARRSSSSAGAPVRMKRPMTSYPCSFKQRSGDRAVHTAAHRQDHSLAHDFLYDQNIGFSDTSPCSFAYNEDNASTLFTGSLGMTDESIETELGVPIPGRNPPGGGMGTDGGQAAPRTRTARLGRDLRQDAPIVLDLGCGNGRFTLLSAWNRRDLDHFAIDILPVVILLRHPDAPIREVFTTSGSRPRTRRHFCEEQLSGLVDL